MRITLVNCTVSKAPVSFVIGNQKRKWVDALLVSCSVIVYHIIRTGFQTLLIVTIARQLNFHACVVLGTRCLWVYNWWPVLGVGFREKRHCIILITHLLVWLGIYFRCEKQNAHWQRLQTRSCPTASSKSSLARVLQRSRNLRYTLFVNVHILFATVFVNNHSPRVIPWCRNACLCGMLCRQ